ncbi:hypothetical protein [Sphingomonas sp. R86520]|uniref:hypothetical protein n=1 Tax=Sphingomonas sp. R86520 TaxID=3093859 RepID=UPI0036D2FBD8
MVILFENPALDEAREAGIAPAPCDAREDATIEGWDTSPTMYVAESYAADVVPWGLDGPRQLRGGDRVTAGITPRLGCEWNAEWLGAIDLACRHQRDADRSWFHMPPLAVTGPCGAGRTHVARRLAWEAGVAYIAIDVSGAAMVSGFGSPARGPTPALPSALAGAMSMTDCANPIIGVTGVETADADTLARLSAAMDPMRSRIDDEGLGITLDLSEATWLVQLPPDAALPPELQDFTTTVALTLPDQPDWVELAWIEALIEVAADRATVGDLGRLADWTDGGAERWRNPNLGAAARYRLAMTAFDQVYGSG